MRIQVFDVVELKNGDKATIINIKTNGYKAAIFDKNGDLKGHKHLKEQDIVNIVYSRKY